MELHYISMFPFKLLAAVCDTVYIMHINSRKNTVIVKNHQLMYWHFWGYLLYVSGIDSSALHRLHLIITPTPPNNIISSLCWVRKLKFERGHLTGLLVSLTFRQNTLFFSCSGLSRKMIQYKQGVMWLLRFRVVPRSGIWVSALFELPVLSWKSPRGAEWAECKPKEK